MIRLWQFLQIGSISKQEEQKKNLNLPFLRTKKKLKFLWKKRKRKGAMGWGLIKERELKKKVGI